MPKQVKLGGVEIEVAARYDKLKEGFRAAEKEAEAAGKKISEALDKGASAEHPAATSAGKKVAEEVANGISSGAAAAERAGKRVSGAAAKGIADGADAAEAAGKKVGSKAAKGAQDSAQRLIAWLKGVFALQATQIAYSVYAKITGALRDSIGAAEEKIQSYTRMNSAAKLFGVSETALIKSSQQAKREYNLTSTAANELAIQTTKMAARAGDASQASLLLARTLDLAAANGGDAARAGEALEQTLRGQDEGTDFLLQKNPSQIYAEWAKANGKAAATLTDVEQKQALVNAILTSGAKVQGAYRNQISGQLGPLTRWRTLQRTLSENLGTALIPFLGKLTDLMSGPLLTATGGFIHFLDRIDRLTSSPLENLIKDLKAAGAETEKILRLETLLQIKELERKDRAYRASPNRRDVVSVAGGLSADDARTIERATGLTLGRTTSEARVSTDVNAQIEGIVTSGYDVTKIGYEHLLQLHRQALTELESLGERVSKGWLDPKEAEDRAKAITDYAVGLQAVIDRRKAAGDTLRELQTTRGAYADLLAGKKPEAAASTAPTTPTGAETQAEKERRLAAAEQLAARVHAYRTLQGPGVSPFGDRPGDLPDTLQRIVQLDQEIAQIEKEIAAARQSAPDGARAVLAAYQQESNALKGQAKEMAAAIDPEKIRSITARLATVSQDIIGTMVVTAERGARPLAAALQETASATKGVTDAERELQAAYLSGDQERIKKAKKEVIAAQEAVKKATADAMKILQAGLKGGQLDQTKYNALLAEMVKLLQEAGIQTEDLTKRHSADWAGLANTVAGVARGVLSVADALGILDERAKTALDSVVNIADAAGTLATNPHDVGAWAQAIGGAVGLVKSLFGKDAESERLLQEHRDAMKDLEKALYSLRDAYLDSIGGDQLRGDQQFAQRAVGVLNDPYIDFASKYANGDGLTAEIARRLGLVGGDASQDQAQAAFERKFEELDQRYGTNLAGLLKNRDFAGILQTLQTLPAAIQDQLDKLGQFGDDVAGIIGKVSWEFQVLGKTDAAARLKAINDALKAAGKNAGDFQAALDELAGLDLNTDAGRARRDAIIQQVVQQMATGGANFGAFSVDEFRQLIQDWSQATSTTDAGAVDSYQVSRSITEVTGNRMIGVLTTISYWVERIARGIGLGAGIPAGMDAASIGVAGGSDAQPWMPSTMAGALARMSTPARVPLGVASSTGTQAALIGAVHVHVTPPLGMSAAEAGQLGRAIGDGVIRKTDEQLGRRLRDRKRAAGSNVA